MHEGRLRRCWVAVVEPSSELKDVADRERAQLLAALLIVLLVVGFASGIVQLLLIDDFTPTFRSMTVALLGVGLAWAFSRTRHYRIAAVSSALMIIVACAVTGRNNPSDGVWYGFMLIAVLLGATFLPPLPAAAIAVAAAAAVAITAAITPALHATERWLPAVMLHAVLSPLVLFLSHHRARVERARNDVQRAQERRLDEVRRFETLGQLAGGVAHDFNNLLSVILSSTEILMLSRTYDDIRVRDIDGAGQRAARLIEQLLRFARGKPHERSHTDLNGLLTGLQPLLEHLKGATVQLEIDLDPSLPRVTIEQSQLEQVIVNLVVNARDAMPNGGALSIRTARHSHADELGVGGTTCAMLRISDTGVGMDAVTQAAIFEPFFTTKGREGGTGLGLAIVEGVVVKGGGSIRVHSEPGCGSTFEVILPCVDPSNDEGVRLILEPKDVMFKSGRA